MDMSHFAHFIKKRKESKTIKNKNVNLKKQMGWIQDNPQQHLQCLQIGATQLKLSLVTGGKPVCVHVSMSLSA